MSSFTGTNCAAYGANDLSVDNRFIAATQGGQVVSKLLTIAMIGLPLDVEISRAAASRSATSSLFPVSPFWAFTTLGVVANDKIKSPMKMGQLFLRIIVWNSLF